ncbi:hypothetical protein IFM89_018270 [Coptis chinensis]|uniref:Uncharacterized protein n=1 Tax=Coptis chinensis TaxID=261450 RepID=A0A835LIX7_9MAGN|nr:hypothetical protein IFM89_018270 [Coptis chinensis]
MMTKEVRVIGKELKTELTTSIRNGMETILQEIVHGKNKVVLETSIGEVKESDGVVRAPRTKSTRKKGNTEATIANEVDLGDVENEARVNDVVMSQVETEARVNDLVAMAGDDNQGRVDDIVAIDKRALLETSEILVYVMKSLNLCSVFELCTIEERVESDTTTRGNSKTLLIVNVCPNVSNLSETLSTLLIFFGKALTLN